MKHQLALRAACVWVFATSICYAAPNQFRFTPVVTPDTLIPGTQVPFENLDNIRIEGNQIVFWGWNQTAGVGGAYQSVDGILSPIIDHTTVLPFGRRLAAVRFGSSHDVILHDGTVAICAWTNQPTSPRDFRGEIYRVRDGQITVVDSASLNATFNWPAIFGDRLAYREHGSTTESLKLREGSQSVVVMSPNDPAPAGLGVFGHSFAPLFDESQLFFSADTRVSQSHPSLTGLFSYRDGEIRHIISESMMAPGRDRAIYDLGQPIIDDGEVVFLAVLDNYEFTHYRYDGSSFYPVSSPNEPIADLPGKTFGTQQMGLRDYEDGRRLFSGTEDLSYHIFLDIDGETRRVLGPGDVVFGREVEIAFTSIGDALSAGRVAMGVQYTDGREGILLATPVPEPAASLVAALGTAGFVLFLQWRKP